MAISTHHQCLILIVLFFCSCTRSQFLSMGSIPLGCGPFQYYNASLDMNNPPSIIHNALNEVEAYLDYLFTITGTPSLSYGIVYDQALIYYKSFGVTNLQTLQQPTADSIYRIGSISKVFTVLMAYVMRDAHQISFDDPIYKYNPKFTIHNPWGVTKKERLGHTLTIQQLASQTSGLPREAPCVYEESDDCINITTAEIFERLSQRYLIHPTDVQASYSNLAFAILGNVLSEFHGDESYNDTLFDLVINQLSLQKTGLYLNDAQKPYAATGYNVSGVDQGYIDIGWEGPAGQMFSSVHDLSELMKQFLASYPSLYQQTMDNEYNFITSPQTLREMLRPVFVNPDQQSGFGAPWEMQMLDGHFIRGKAGNIDGFSSSIDMIPEMKLGVIALSNYELDESVFTLGTLEILLPAFKSWMNSIKSQGFKPKMPQNISEYVGLYYVTNTIALFEVYIQTKTNYLMVSSNINGFYGILTWIDGHKFVYNDLYDNTASCWTKTLGAAMGITIEFVTDATGNINGVTLYDLDYGTIFPKHKGGKGNRTYSEFLKYRQRKQNKCSNWRSSSYKSKVHLGAKYTSLF